jgi:hypothetical protein
MAQNRKSTFAADQSIRAKSSPAEIPTGRAINTISALPSLEVIISEPTAHPIWSTPCLDLVGSVAPP